MIFGNLVRMLRAFAPCLVCIVAFSGIAGCNGASGSKPKATPGSDAGQPANNGDARSLPSPIAVRMSFGTESIKEDPDDPAVWINPSDPSKSLIFGTDKKEAPNGSLYAFNLSGTIVDRIPNLDRPNNCDVESAVPMGRDTVDIVAVTERGKQRLLIYRIDRNSGKLKEISGANAVFEGETGDAALPMGVALFKRKNGTTFAILSRKTGPSGTYLWQYELVPNTKGLIDLKLTRKFGDFIGGKEIESVCVDDELGFVYYSDEGYGIHKYFADPDAPKADNKLTEFAREGWKGDHEGIAIYKTGLATGYIVCTDQIEGDSIFTVYPREGSKTGGVDDHQPLARFTLLADDTDGIEITSANLGKDFPSGLMVAMNSGTKNFVVADWRKIAEGCALKLAETKP